MAELFKFTSHQFPPKGISVLELIENLPQDLKQSAERACRLISIYCVVHDHFQTPDVVSKSRLTKDNILDTYDTISPKLGAIDESMYADEWPYLFSWDCMNETVAARESFGEKKFTENLLFSSWNAFDYSIESMCALNFVNSLCSFFYGAWMECSLDYFDGELVFYDRIQNERTNKHKGETWKYEIAVICGRLSMLPRLEAAPLVEEMFRELGAVAARRSSGKSWQSIVKKVDPNEQIAGGDDSTSYNDDRNRFIYEEWNKGTHWKSIVKGIRERTPEWRIITTLQGLKKAADTYAKGKNISPPKKRV